jgi:hypothetical protein
VTNIYNESLVEGDNVFLASSSNKGHQNRNNINAKNKRPKQIVELTKKKKNKYGLKEYDPSILIVRSMGSSRNL